MITMSDTLTISDADLDAMMSAVLPCDKCQGEAHFMSRGHRCRPPGFRAFKCQSCCAEWVAMVENRLSRGPIRHDCGTVCFSVSDLSDYRLI